MHENRNLFLFLIKINNMHRTRHILPIRRTCICRHCGRCGVSWHRVVPDMLVCVKLKITRTIGKYGHAATNLVVFLHGFCVAYSLVSICQVIGWERWVLAPVKRLAWKTISSMSC